MADFCLKCWNRINKTEYSEKKYIISKDLDLCEGCGKMKPVIIMDRRAYYICKLKYITLPIRIIFVIIYTIYRLLLLPYSIYKYNKLKSNKIDT